MPQYSFDPSTHLAPQPFREDVCRLAQELRDNGLVWKPHVGCFVWDPQDVIKVPSPFPQRIYFILSMRRFLDIFGSVEAMAEHMVWLPTWHQARLAAAALGVPSGELASAPSRLWQQPGDELIWLYGRIRDRLGVDADTADSVAEANRGRERLFRAAVAHHLGDLNDLPEALKERVRSVYMGFIGGYLPLLGQKLGQSADWVPDTWWLDLEVLAGMGHFFSDYQRIARDFQDLNDGIGRLRKIDRQAHDLQYQRALENLLAPAEPASDLYGLA